MARISILHPLASILVFSIIGCSTQTGPDSNVQVFRTVDQEGVARRAKLADEWVQLALKFNNADRPDAKTIAHPTQKMAVLASADGVERVIDLSPLSEKLAGNPGKEREPIRAKLAEEMRLLDRERLIKLGFDKAQKLLHPVLASGKQLADMARSAGAQTPVSRAIVIDLNWVPVARWPGSDAQTPVEPDVVKAWHTTADNVVDAALANLKRDFVTASQGAPVFDTSELPGLGRYGTLRSGMDPGYALIPEFLSAVRRAWETEDDLVLLMPARTSVTFVPRSNTKVQDRMIPEWEKRFASFADPLIGVPVVLTERGAELSTYKPAGAAGAKPATKPAPPKPTGYIVN
ncbi:MAG: hypothetical protein ACAI43_22350 [Phycisphaerae bacterium]